MGLFWHMVIGNIPNVLDVIKPSGKTTMGLGNNGLKQIARTLRKAQEKPRQVPI